MFSIISFNLEIEFAATTKEELESWMKGFQKLQREFDLKREQQKKEIPI